MCIVHSSRKRPGSGKKTASNAQLDSSVSDNDATPTIKKVKLYTRTRVPIINLLCTDCFSKPHPENQQQRKG